MRLKLIKWLVKILLPGYHLKRKPVRREKLSINKGENEKNN